MNTHKEGNVEGDCLKKRSTEKQVLACTQHGTEWDYNGPSHHEYSDPQKKYVIWPHHGLMKPPNIHPSPFALIPC